MEKQPIELDRFAGKEEAVVARRLVRKALALGYTVSVYDGEEWPVLRSTARMEILAALASTGMDTLLFRRDGQPIGKMMLVYQNGPGDELIADYSGNELMDQLFKLANNQ